MTSYTYDKVTSDMHHQIELVNGQVRAYVQERKLSQAQQLAITLWGAFRLWEQITRGDQKDGEALRFEQAIEKTQAEADPPIHTDGPSPIIQMLAKWVRGGQVSDEALYRMQQASFIYPDAKGKLQLTPAGKQTLQENGVREYPRNPSMETKKEMTVGEEVSLLASALIQSGPQAPQSMPALRPG